MSAPFRAGWRHGLLLAVVGASLGVAMSLGQDALSLANNDFADHRGLLWIPNVMDVLSGVPFLVVGALSLRFLNSATVGPCQKAWLVFFAGISFVSLGSGYYHWDPTDGALVWDRLPMTVGFMGLFAALVGEYVDAQVGRAILLPAVLAGLGSVFFWYWTGELRPYVWIQFMPLLALPVMMLLFKPSYSHQWVLLLALAFYVLAKLTELYDQVIFEGTGNLISGHSIKHLLAACGCYVLFWMLSSRRPVTQQ